MLEGGWKMPVALIVDDEPSIMELIREILVEEGYGANCASCGEEALELCNLHNFDVIFLDVCMPGMSGVDVARELRTRASTARTPLVFCTVMDSNEDIFDGFDAGGNVYLVKPFNREQITAAVKLIAREADAAG